MQLYKCLPQQPGTHGAMRLTRLVRNGWDGPFQSQHSILPFWNWTVSNISLRILTYCGMRKSRLLLLEQSKRVHISSAGVRPVMSEHSCIFFLPQLNCASWNTWNKNFSFFDWISCCDRDKPRCQCADFWLHYARKCFDVSHRKIIKKLD